MTHQGHEIKPVTGKRVGDGPVEVWREGHYVDTYPNKEVAKKKIDAVMAKMKPIYDYAAEQKAIKNARKRANGRNPDWTAIREKYGRSSK